MHALTQITTYMSNSMHWHTTNSCACFCFFRHQELVESAARFLHAYGENVHNSAQQEPEADQLYADGLRKKFADICTGGEQDDVWKVTQYFEMQLSRSASTASDSIFAVAKHTKQLLLDEMAQLSELKNRALSLHLVEEIKDCRPHVDVDPPDVDKLDALRKVARQKSIDARRAAFNKEEAKEQYEVDEHQFLEEYNAARTKLKQCQRALQNANAAVDAEMVSLSQQGSKHWPEVLVNVPSLADFQDIPILRRDLTFESFEEPERLDVGGHHPLFAASLQERRVVLKQYDLNGVTTAKVLEEVKKVLSLRHPNIVEMQSVFEQEDKISRYLYVQMPHYASDLKGWLRANPNPTKAEQRRKFLLGGEPIPQAISSLISAYRCCILLLHQCH